MNWHGVQQAAPLLGLNPESVYLLCASGRLAHRRVGVKAGRGKIQISDEGIAEFLKACEIPVAPQGSPAPSASAKKRPKTYAASGRADGKPIKRAW